MLQQSQKLFSCGSVELFSLLQVPACCLTVTRQCQLRPTFMITANIFSLTRGKNDISTPATLTYLPIQEGATLSEAGVF